MGKYFDTYNVKKLYPFQDYSSFIHNAWIPNNKRVAWMIYPAYRDLQVRMIASHVFTGEDMTGVLIWERTRGKIYTFLLSGALQYRLGWFSSGFNSTTLKKMRLSNSIIKNLRPLDTWTFVFNANNGNMWGPGWTEQHMGAAAIGFWTNRELAKHFIRYHHEDGFVGMSPHFGCFLDGVFHHGDWHQRSTMDVMKRRWRKENDRS